jgi:VanZ family protein
MKFVKYHLPLIAYAVVIFLLSSLTGLPGSLKLFTVQDKVLHFLEFSILGWLLWQSARRWRISLPKLSLLIAVLLLGAVYAASDEFHQSYVPGRDCHILDWTADTVGLAAGALTSYIFSERKEKT